MQIYRVFESKNETRFSVFGGAQEDAMAVFVSENEEQILNQGITFAGPYLTHLGTYVLEWVTVSPVDENGVAIHFGCSFETRKPHSQKLFENMTIDFAYGLPSIDDAGQVASLPRCFGFSFRVG